MSQNIDRKQLLDHLRERFGLTMGELLDVLRVPTHPRELRDEIAMRATIDDVNEHRVYASGHTYESAKYAYADAMLAARLEPPK